MSGGLETWLPYVVAGLLGAFGAVTVGQHFVRHPITAIVVSVVGLGVGFGSLIFAASLDVPIVWRHILVACGIFVMAFTSLSVKLRR